MSSIPGNETLAKLIEFRRKMRRAQLDYADMPFAFAIPKDDLRVLARLSGAQFDEAPPPGQIVMVMGFTVKAV